MTHGASGTSVLVVRGRGTNLLLLTMERSRGILLRRGFRDRTNAIKAKAKAKIDRRKVGDTSGLLVNQDRGHVIIATSLGT